MTSPPRPSRGAIVPAWQRSLWIALQFACVLAAMVAFFVLVPWLSARPVADATPEILAALPPGCPAFAANHGTYTCFASGTAHDNPAGALLCALAVVCGIGFAVWIDRRRLGLNTDPLRRWIRARWRAINLGSAGERP